MKRILALLLALSMLFALTACGGDDESTPTGESTGETTSTTENTNDATDGTEETTESTENPNETTSATESTTKPTENSKPTENTKPTETTKPQETQRPTESTKPQETQKPTESTKPSHTHSYSSATCTASGNCACGAIREPALGHSFSQGKCSRCGILEPNSSTDAEYTKGLKLGECMWGDGYSVWGIGTATDTNIIIPSTYNGRPVIEIYENAFKDCTKIKSVSIPSSVLEIGTSSFSGCTSLETVSIPEGLTNISSKAFYNCDSLKQINIPNSIQSISKNSFENCENLKYNEFNNGLYLGNQSNPYIVLITAKSCEELVLNNKTLLIAHDALSNNTQIKTVTISNSVRFVGRNAFLGCKNLTNITFGTGLERIYINAFKDCKSLESAVFAQNHTWGVNKYGYGTSLTTISTNDASVNAYNLKNKYCDYFWGNELVPKTFKQCKSCAYTQNANNLKCEKCGISNWHR